ncbi:shikimate dehydrogenase [Variovorax sp. Sphag1AA]|uniref:shikimate dehydrogenase n=1 Tax=Variovorax sp. Sphag1AA TaxID=2587027 RepID=UPI00160AD257|nr:shikimate dehydrogenase [Variovorax sp. Sphag1AA]MBB3181560.1 shikimate dehydrogenase [Variovorax sp. Sphag1AA]
MTDQYAVIGNPIGHTKSPMIHGTFAQTTGQDIEYTAIEGPLDGFAGAVLAFRDAGGRGMNVTAPFKLQAFELATDRLERAELAGATNALKFEGDRIYADNFDGVGLVNDITRNLGVSMKGARVLLLGAGGAVRGALKPFLSQEPSALVLANRKPEKAQDLVKQFDHPALTSLEFNELVGQQFDIVVNATSASLKAELPAVPAEVFIRAKLAYELAYGKGLTPFLRLAKNAGVPQLADGVGMLVEQAAEAFAWWRGVRPDTRALIERMTIPLV